MLHALRLNRKKMTFIVNSNFVDKMDYFVLAPCCVCKNLLSPHQDDFTTLVFKNKDGNETVKYVCVKCEIVFDESYKEIFCHVCGNLPNGPIYDLVINFENFTSRVVIVACSEKCKKISLKSSRKEEHLELNIKCVCGKIDKKQKKCGNCKSVYYCSRECQKNDWNNHKHKCIKH
jgi:MYND finger